MRRLLIILAFLLPAAGAMAVVDTTIHGMTKATPTSLPDSLCIEIEYKVGATWYSRYVSVRQLIVLMRDTTTTGTYSGGKIGLKIQGTHRWHLAQDISDDVTIAQTAGGVLYVPTGGIGVTQIGALAVTWPKLAAIVEDSIRQRQPHEQGTYTSFDSSPPSMNFTTGVLTIPAGRVWTGDGTYCVATAYSGSPSSNATAIIFTPATGLFSLQTGDANNALNISNRNVIVGSVDPLHNMFWFRGNYAYIKSGITYQSPGLLDNIPYSALSTTIKDSIRQRQPHEDCSWISISDTLPDMNYITYTLTIPRGRLVDGLGVYTNTPFQVITFPTSNIYGIIIDPSEQRFIRALGDAIDDSLSLSNDRSIIGLVRSWVYNLFWWKGPTPPPVSAAISQQYFFPPYPGGVLQMYSGADSLYITTGWDNTNKKTYLSMYSIDSSTDFQYNSEIIPLVAFKSNSDLPTNFITVRYSTQAGDSNKCYLQVQVLNSAGTSVYTSPTKLFSAGDGLWYTHTIAKSAGTISTIAKNAVFYVKINYYSKVVSGTGQYARSGQLSVNWVAP